MKTVVPLPAIVATIVADHAQSRLGDFRDLLADALDTHRYETTAAGLCVRLLAADAELSARKRFFAAQSGTRRGGEAAAGAGVTAKAALRAEQRRGRRVRGKMAKVRVDAAEVVEEEGPVSELIATRPFEDEVPTRPRPRRRPEERVQGILEGASRAPRFTGGVTDA